MRRYCLQSVESGASNAFSHFVDTALAVEFPDTRLLIPNIFHLSLFLLRTLLDLRRNTSLNVFPQGTSLPHEGTKQKELRGVNSKALKAQEFGAQEISFE